MANVRDEARWLHQHVVPAFGDKPLQEVAREDLKALVTSLCTTVREATGRPYSSRTVLHIYRTTATASADAVLDEHLVRSPCTLRTRKASFLPSATSTRGDVRKRSTRGMRPRRFSAPKPSRSIAGCSTG